MMQAPGDRVVNMVVVRHRFVPAAGTMLVIGRTGRRLRMAAGMRDVHFDHVFIDVIAVLVVEMAVVEIVDVIVVTHRDMATSFSVDVLVLAFMNVMGHAHNLRGVSASAKQVLTGPIPEHSRLAPHVVPPGDGGERATG
jgi:hypothetical protein